MFASGLRLFALALLAGLPVLRAAKAVASASEGARANPIRKVVTMLQTLQKKVETEGEEEEVLFKKFMCYCTTGKSELSDTIAAAESKVPAVSSSIEESQGEKEQLNADLKSHREDRDAAKASVAESTGIREKEAAEYAASKAELSTNIGAINNAVGALERGMAGGFLQTGNAQVLRKLVESSEDMIDQDRQSVLAFLAGAESTGYSPQSGSITGILKQTGDEMTKNLNDQTAAEEEAIKKHEVLVGAKSKEIAASTQAIEQKTVRVGEVAVSIVEMKNDLSDTQAALVNDKTFLKELETGCSTKQAEWDERQKTRSEELLALSETIKLLNDDDALELFKKALPSPGASFVQISGSASRLRARALAVLKGQRTSGRQRPGLDLIALALQSKTTGFEKVVAMIDEMVKVLKNEQQDDNHKKEYCGTQLDLADDKKKKLETTASDEEASTTNAEEAVATLTADLKALAAGIDDLDKSVAEATEQRKEDNVAFTELMAMDTQAKDLIGLAKNRMNQFYNPGQYVAPPKKELTQEEKIYQSVAGASFMQISAHSRHGVAPAPPPETFGDYSKKSEGSTGTIAMMDMLIKDLDLEMTEAETSEKDAQKDYESMLADAKAKRAADSSSIAEKEGAKASAESEAESHKEANAAATKELVATAEYIHGLHAECDWLVENFDVRKAARAGEVESLANAKAVLSGADFSLVQLRGSRQRLA